MKASHLATFALLFAVAGGLGQACGGSGGAGGSGGTGTTTTTIPPLPKSICLAENCQADVECAACDDGRTRCDTAQRRCIACGPASAGAVGGSGGGDVGAGGGCPDGQACSPWGACSSSACPVENGIPAVTCQTSADCAACDPSHQVCEPAAHKCVACTASDTSRCQANETCTGGDCVPRCPETCATDADCALCGAPGQEAHQCHNHQCAKCSAEKGCGSGGTCGDHGTCEEPCGAVGWPRGQCSSDADCSTCAAGATRCNGAEVTGKGLCGPAAPSCGELGAGVPLFPPPYDGAVTPCLEDTDCAGAGVQVDIGALLRDLTGWPQIHDAPFDYPAPLCEPISVSESDEGCGVCVPCRADADCAPFDVDQVAAQAFGPLGAVGQAYVMDQIFGGGPHQIFMYCQLLGQSYGVCAPCPGLTADCRPSGPPGNTGTPCHDECTPGNPLGAQCGACATAVCQNDPYCCTVEWDQACADQVGNHCSRACETCDQPGQGGHRKCDLSSTAPLVATCSPCVGRICETRPECCSTAWDQTCVDMVPEYCDAAYLCPGQCNDPAQCTPLGCLATYKCGGCVHDYDCTAGQSCDPGSGDCY